jgi:hypothetical protein
MRDAIHQRFKSSPTELITVAEICCYQETKEVMTIMVPRTLKDGEVVVTDTGVPIVAAGLVQFTHASRLTVIRASWVVDANGMKLL